MARARRARNERGIAHMSVKHHRCKPPLPVIVTLIRLSAGTLDSDNLQGAMKHVRDGVADAFGVADNDPRIAWRYDQERTKRGVYGVRIQMEAS